MNFVASGAVNDAQLLFLISVNFFEFANFIMILFGEHDLYMMKIRWPMDESPMKPLEVIVTLIEIIYFSVPTVFLGPVGLDWIIPWTTNWLWIMKYVVCIYLSSM